MSDRFFGHLLEHMEKRREVRHKKEELELLEPQGARCRHKKRTMRAPKKTRLMNRCYMRVCWRPHLSLALFSLFAFACNMLW